MTYYPQPDPANPARRVQVGGSVAVAIRSEGAEVVRAKLCDLSVETTSKIGARVLLRRCLFQ